MKLSNESDGLNSGEMSKTYVILPHPDDKIFKYVKSEFKPISIELQSYKNFKANFKAYKNR